MESSNKKRASARFDGHVQGVGFRYTTAGIAAKFDVTGYVKNLHDGTVELVAEGEERAIMDFLTALRASQVYQYVTKEHVSWSPAVGEFTEFGVGY